jgi:hypothetical protein
MPEVSCAVCLYHRRGRLSHPGATKGTMKNRLHDTKSEDCSMADSNPKSRPLPSSQSLEAAAAELADLRLKVANAERRLAGLEIACPGSSPVNDQARVTSVHAGKATLAGNEWHRESARSQGPRMEVAERGPVHAGLRADPGMGALMAFQRFAGGPAKPSLAVGASALISSAGPTRGRIRSRPTSKKRKPYTPFDSSRTTFQSRQPNLTTPAKWLTSLEADGEQGKGELLPAPHRAVHNERSLEIGKLGLK